VLRAIKTRTTIEENSQDMHKLSQMKLKPGLGTFYTIGQERDRAYSTAPGALHTGQLLYTACWRNEAEKTISLGKWPRRQLHWLPVHAFRFSSQLGCFMRLFKTLFRSLVAIKTKLRCRDRHCWISWLHYGVKVKGQVTSLCKNIPCTAGIRLDRTPSTFFLVKYVLKL